MKLKKIIVWGATVTLLLTSLLFSGCGASNANENSETKSSDGSQNSKTLNVLCWSEYIPDSVLDDFQKKTGIKVNLTTFSSIDEEFSKIESGKDGTYDLLIGGSITELVKNQKIDKLNYDKLPNYQYIEKGYRTFEEDPEGAYTVPYMGVTAVIAVNTDKIKEPITSYQDLLKPAYKDNIVIIDDAQAVVGMANMATNHKFNDLSPEALNDAKSYLEKLRPNIHAFNGDSPKTLLLNGECSIGLIYNGEAALAQEQNPNIKIYYPTEGVYYSFDHASITSSAQNKDNAYEFLNYILDPEVSKEIATQYPYISPNTKAVDMMGDAYKNNPLFVIASDVLKRCQTPNGRTSAEKTEIANIWTQIKE